MPDLTELHAQVERRWFFVARSARVLATAVLLIAGWSPLQAQSRDAFVPVTDVMLQDPDPEDWLMWRRTLNGWGFSPLNQIDRDNVSELRMVWSRAMAPGSQQATPLVYDGVMYLPNPATQPRRSTLRPATSGGNTVATFLKTSPRMWAVWSLQTGTWPSTAI